MRVSQNKPSSTERRKGRQRACRPFFSVFDKTAVFRVHPLFLLVGIWYACTGELFFFLLSALVAIQHECAHAYAAAKLGYRLHTVVLMPFGAVLDGDMKDASLKDEIFVAFCGPLCNLLTAVFFVALWWFAPTMYAFTDTAFYSSMAIALVNLLPAYPLDGGRIFKCLLTRFLAKKHADFVAAEGKAVKICKAVTLTFALFLFTCFVGQWLARGKPNLSLFLFGLFLALSAFGNRGKNAVYARMDFSRTDALRRGVEIRRVAVTAACPIKNVFRFLSNQYFLVLEVYDEKNEFLCQLTQNELSALFALASSPYTPLYELLNATMSAQK
ncbi:MAG: site-2 protease family protein [Clostridia bacterium]|nr:site-2 protease family protein [Clostridia bacterium]